MKKATAIESTSVLPAKIVVRPAVRRVVQAASIGIGAGRYLLAEARDHQEGVVHPQRQAHHRTDGQRQGADVEPVGEDREQAARGEDRDGAEAERDRCRHRRAEDEQKDDQKDRQGNQLGPLATADRLVLDRAQERGEAGLRGANRRVDRFFEDTIDQGHPVVDGLVEVVVEVGDDQGAAGARPQLPDRADCPRAKAWSLSGRGGGCGSAPGPGGRSPPACPAGGLRTERYRRSTDAACR